MNINIKNISIKKILLVALLIRLLLLPFGTHTDVGNHVVWGRYGQEFGFKGYYDWLNFFAFNRPNQPPLTIITYTFVKNIHSFFYQPLWFVNTHLPLFPSKLMTWYANNGFSALLKLPSSLADIAIGFLLYKIALKIFKHKNKSLIVASIYLFNPVTFYNSAIWGQTDAYICFFFLLALALLVFKPNLPLALPIFALSLLTKASLIIFLPPLLIFYFKNKPKISNLLISLFLSLIFIYLTTSPFAPDFFLTWTYRLYTKVIIAGELHYLTANAFNFWALAFGFKPIMDSINIISYFTAYQIGLFVFAIYYCYLLVSLWRHFNLDNLLLSLTLMAFGSFLLLTRMHERYLFPIFIPMTILAVKNILPLSSYWTLSLIHLVNLYHYWWYPKIYPVVYLLSLSLIEKTLILSLIYIFVKFNLIYQRRLE